MGATKRMHYVPRTYLKHFSTATVKGPNDILYRIHAVPVPGLDESALKLLSITDVCLENDLYTLPGQSPQERLFLENMYNELYEKGYDSYYALLTDESREKISPLERRSIISFVVSMFYRNNSWGNAYNKLMDETYAKAFALAKEHGNESFFMDDKEISIAGKTLKEFQKENKEKDRPMIALSQAQRIFELVRLRLINDVITVVKLENTNLEFITGDNPVTYRDSPSKHPMPLDPENTLSIPLDSKHLLQLRPWGHELDKDLIGRMDATSIIAEATTVINNHFQAAQAGRFILGTESGLRTFLKNKDKYNK
jgi:hypothetical protein